ncbi:MAG TPA: sigma 54-interacting transcriptional regulator [Candidatus Sulfopaludibacter sp.]|jgi:Nif-specific regulatory protein|nr:sigma 54-interacting transcriptional regulator [Candidatus Sulfopaludibacter sp.]
MGSEQPALNEKLAAILEICQKMNSERDLGALLDLIAREATNLLDCDRASIFLLDRERNELWSKVALGSEEILRFDARRGIAGTATQTGATINVKDAYSDPRFYNAIDGQTGYHTRNVLAVAVRNQRREIIGAFEVLNKRMGSVFTSRDEEVLDALASHAAIAIETAQLIGELRRSQDELVQQNAHLWREVENKYSAHGIIGTGHKIQQIVRLIERIRDSQVNVLITGESGTGKEQAAKAIHYTSARARRPFVALNCAALPETLVESELFGIEKGVATGVNSRLGQFQKADGGTLFLDEIGDLSLTAQAKILRVLQERVVERVGGNKPVPVDVRLLAATNKDLEAEIGKGTFREDLYYRIKVIHIHMPPLRDIREEIPLLANHFLKEYCRETTRAAMEFTSDVVRKLANSPWPGNVRQLRNEVMRLAACARQNVITEEDLMEGIPMRGPAEPALAPLRLQSLKVAVEELELRMIQQALNETRSNQQQAAKLLGLSRQGLINKMKRYAIAG